MGSLKKILPEAVSEAVEEAFLGRLRAKISAGASNLVLAIRAVEGVYGDAGVQIISRAFAESWTEAGKERAKASPDNSLRSFCSAIELICIGSHEWTKLEDSDTRQAYRFTRCMWAEAFRELEAEDIGYWVLCQGDSAMASSFNPMIGFSRTKTLMMGDDCCDHVYYLKTH
jgi:L-2-amino-thiazoline-4-carboxylic acid hydrolase